MESDAVLDHARRHPAVDLAGGERLIAGGDDAGALYVLVRGRLDVVRSGMTVATLREPGSVVGELAVLLGEPATADVVAAEPTRVHRIDDPEALFAEQPEFALYLARMLAGRLRRITGYLVDLREQYADHGGALGLVGEVVGDLLATPQRVTEHGSEREPDSPY